MSDFEKAKRMLLSGGYTCVMCKGESVYTSFDRGVKPLVLWHESHINLRGFSAADKVIGKGAAFLYILIGVCKVYAGVISTPALNLLKEHGVVVEYGTEVDRIVNRKGDGICPFEEAVLDIEDAESAYTVIHKKMKEMNISTKVHYPKAFKEDCGSRKNI